MSRNLPQHAQQGPPAAVAVSGGLDSLLALALLARQGQALAAVHARFLEPATAATARRQRLENACRKLDVPLLHIDLCQAFEQLICRPFTLDYLEGRTPNPCALCNPRIKFGLLFQEALTRLGRPEARFATGHYAGIVRHPERGPLLARGADQAKDQSYFLALLPKSLLGRLTFPLAGVSKQDAADMLRDMGISPPEQEESQEICFIPDNDYRTFIQRHAAGLGLELPGPGPVLLPDGQRIGTHQGLWRYTQGQRRGLDIPWRHPLYVLGKDVAANALIVGGPAARRSERCLLQDVNLFVPLEQWPAPVLAQVRYRQKPRPVRVEPQPDGLMLFFEDPQQEAADGPPAPGQLGVCYSEDGLVLAGGRIASDPFRHPEADSG